MGNEINEFTPEWLPPPPGTTIADILEELGWSQNELASRLDFTPKHVNQLIKGEATITEETALKLERVLGSTMGFWLAREAQYREALKREEERLSLENDIGWLKQLPLKDMINFGWIQPFKNKAQQVAACLRFFGVASVSVWTDKWTHNLAALRAQPLQEKHKGALAAWIRQCEHQAQFIECQTYDSSKFKNILSEARKLTLEEDTEILIPKLQQLCADAGVILVVVPAPSGCPAYGATRWLNPEKALLMLNDRYKTIDQFWFSFFHEAAHILLHAKKVLYIDTEGELDGKDEDEADEFASNTLIPPNSAKKLCLLKNRTAIKLFAQDLHIAPGIVVGRMQRDGLLSWSSPFNELKTKINFN